jgi:hypothetical protein
MGTGAGHLRFRPWASHLKARANPPLRMVFARARWRLPRFYPPCDYLVPLHEYPRARYATGYLGDIGVPTGPNPMD